MSTQRLQLIRACLNVSPLKPAPKPCGMARVGLPPRPERKRTLELRPPLMRYAVSMNPHGAVTMRVAAKFIATPDAVSAPALRTKRTAKVSALARIAAHADAPIPGCRHFRPVQRSQHGQA